MVTTNFTEDFVRDAARNVLKAEYRRLMLGGPLTVVLGTVLVAGLAASGLINTGVAWGVLAGLVAAGIVVGIMSFLGYRQSIGFALRVLRNEGSGEVSYELSETGCKVRYKAVDVLLPWKLLRSREPYKEYEVLAFGASEEDSDRARVRETLEAMSRGAAGPALLGFPIFCAIPRSRARYVFIPPALLRDSRHVLTV
jgi:hypothetical protein